MPLLKHMPLEGPLLTFKAFREAVQATAQSLQFDTRLGLEVDFVPGKNEHIQSFVQGKNWDFLIGSVHEIDGIQFEADYKWSRDFC